MPLLLPIKLLTQLRAVVDLDRNVLEIRSFNVEAPLSELPSGHVAVSITDFAPEVWSVPTEALNAKLCHDQFVLMSNDGVGHSMNELRSFVSVSPPAAVDDGIASYGANVGSARGRCDAETAKGSCDHEESESAERMELSDHMKLIDLHPQVQDWLPSSSLQFSGLAASIFTRGFTTCYPATKQADAQLEYSEVIRYASFLG